MKGFTLAYRLKVGSWLLLAVGRLALDLLSCLMAGTSLTWFFRLRSAGRSPEEQSPDSELLLSQLR